MLKLVVVGNPTCGPCVLMKNKISENIEDLWELDCEFLYVSLNELQDKDTFIVKHNISSTPTVWIEKDGEKEVQFDGYKDVEELFRQIGGLK